MKAFDYAAPTSVEDAVKLLEPRHAEALSGGTDLLCRMKDYVTSPERVVYLNDIKDPHGNIGAGRHGDLRLSAFTRLAEVVASKEIKEKYPALWQATLEVGTPQIKNMATVGGNLLQRPRCWYYRAGHGLLGMKDGQSLVRAGDNRYHSIFLTDGDALFVSPSSLAVPLVALGAKATLRGPRGERTVAVEQLYRVPKNEHEGELAVHHGEVLTEVTIPAPGGKNAAYEARQKQAHDWPLVMCAVNLETDGDRVSDSRVVIYGVAPIPWRSEEAEQAIKGKTITPDTAGAAGEAATRKARPLSMNGYKIPLTRTVVKRALLAAVGNRYWEEA